MLREKVEKLAKGLLSGLAMALCVVTVNPAAQAQAAILQESESNDNPATANVLPLNTWIRGDISQYYDQDWFRFEIPQDGYSWIEIKPTDDNTNSSAKWSYEMQDVQRHILLDGCLGNGYASTEKAGWAPGKYYVNLSQYNGIGLSSAYNLRIRYVKANNWEKERYYAAKKLENANIVTANKNYTGNLYCGRDVDWYRFKLKGKNRITLKFTIDDSVANPGTWKVTTMDKNRKTVGEGTYLISSSETWTIGACADDLIVKVEAWNTNAVGALYHIRATAAPNVVQPSATTITSITGGKQQATIRWRKAENATGYYVYRSESANGTYKKIATVTGKTYYTDKKSLKSQRAYYYKIVSYRKSGSKILTSKASERKGVKIK